MNDLVRSWDSCKCEKQRGKECVAERGRSKMMDTVNVTGAGTRICLVEDFEVSEDPRTPSLRRISYGIILPTICCFGIVGNILNLVVLTRRNMRGTAYIYMRGYSAAALLAILFCIPFALRVLIHKETGRWRNWMQAFYHTHLELFLGNGCLGVGVMMLLALTVERYVSVCRPGQHTRPLCGPPHLTVALIPLATFLVYLPSVFREEITTCLLAPDGPVIYQKRENQSYLDSMFYQVYKVILEIVFKVAPTILLAGFNLRIMIVYRRSCERRRRMTLSRTASNDEDPRTFAEERRLVLLLGSTSILFLVCVSPMVILNVTLRESNLSHYPYQVFRALANLLEVINYSITFYIYCMFSEDFRNTLIRTLQWPCRKTSHEGRGLPMKRSSIPRPTTTTTTTTTITTTTLPTTAVATPGHLTRASVYWRLVSLFLSYPHQSHLKGEKPRETEFSQPQNSDAVYQSTSSGSALTSIPRLLNIITRYRIHRQILVYRDSRFAYGTNSNQRDIELSFLPSKLSNKKIHQFFTVMHSTLIGSATEPQIYSSD